MDACQNAGFRTAAQLLEFYCTLVMRCMKKKLRRFRAEGILFPALRQCVNIVRRAKQFALIIVRLRTSLL